MHQRRAFVLVVSFTAVLCTVSGVHAQQAAGKEDRVMCEQATEELERLRRNQAMLLAAINRIIADTAPIALANPADLSSGYVTTGLVLGADGLIAPGTIRVSTGPQSTLRGVRPGDPLWVDQAGSP